MISIARQDAPQLYSNGVTDAEIDAAAWDSVIESADYEFNLGRFGSYPRAARAEARLNVERMQEALRRPAFLAEFLNTPGNAEFSASIKFFDLARTFPAECLKAAELAFDNADVAVEAERAAIRAERGE